MEKQTFLECHYFWNRWPEADPLTDAYSKIESLIKRLPGCSESDTTVNLDAVDDAEDSVFMKKYYIKNLCFTLIEHTNKTCFGFAIGIMTIDSTIRSDYSTLLRQHFPEGDYEELFIVYNHEADPYEMGEKFIAIGALSYLINKSPEVPVVHVQQN